MILRRTFAIRRVICVLTDGVLLSVIESAREQTFTIHKHTHTRTHPYIQIHIEHIHSFIHIHIQCLCVSSREHKCLEALKWFQCGLNEWLHVINLNISFRHLFHSYCFLCFLSIVISTLLLLYISRNITLCWWMRMFVPPSLCIFYLSSNVIYT